MELTKDAVEQLEATATEVLVVFDGVATAAEQDLQRDPIPPSAILASGNAMTSKAVAELQRIYQANRDNSRSLASEPAIARVVIGGDNEAPIPYYICRGTPVPASVAAKLASYRSPIGRLASLEVGEEFVLPGGRLIRVLERALLFPLRDKGGWDSVNSRIQGGALESLTVESLRALRDASARRADHDLVAQLLAEEAQRTNIIEGVRRSVIHKMSLRDQPVLDQYQDDIFRLPLNRRLLILGPPGTGKTTTLIRRLGQKIDTDYLDDGEKRAVQGAASDELPDHSDSWLMFTPTELLKQYLKEAFARERVPAPDQRITTWVDFRRHLARDVFDVLRTATSRGGFVLKESAEVLSAQALDRPLAWFSDFFTWQESEYLMELGEAGEVLSRSAVPEFVTISRKVAEEVGSARLSRLDGVLISLAGEAARIQTLTKQMQEATDELIKGSLNLQLNKDAKFIDELSRFIDALEEAPDIEADELEDVESEEEPPASRTGRAAALSAYRGAIRAQARAYFRGKALARDARYGKIVGWLGSRMMDESKLREIGESLVIQSSARRFVSPAKRYVDGAARRYRAFRRLRQAAGTWYRVEDFNQRDLHPLELDIVLLATLKGAVDLLSKTGAMRDLDNPAWSSFKRIVELFRNQILIDEATDFSPIQIGCMSALSHPNIHSVTACGDFNQRLTTWGTRSVEEAVWALPAVEVKQVRVSYRQSKKLNELSREIVLACGGEDPRVGLPADVDNEGVPPALLEGAASRIQIVTWLADRVREIEQHLDSLPSIAVFVLDEADVQPLADALNAELAGENIPVVGCLRGQVRGQEDAVRVFDVQHIKGLEFEAAFFVGVDQLAKLHPGLFDKYLYVGATRAATYLGLTCLDCLPETISSLRDLCVANWKEFL